MNKNIEKILEDYILGKYNLETCGDLVITEINKALYNEIINKNFNEEIDEIN